MPWQVSNTPKTDYLNRIVNGDDDNWPLVPKRNWKTDNFRVNNIGVNKFRTLFKRKDAWNDFEVFQVIQANKLELNEKDSKEEELMWSSYNYPLLSFTRMDDYSKSNFQMDYILSVQ